MLRSLSPPATSRLYSEVCQPHEVPQSAASTADLVCARMEAGQLRFSSQEDRHQAFSTGVFLLHIPDDLDVGAADQFANEFYRGDASLYGGFKALTSGSFDDGLLGFHRWVDQIEQFLLERRFWGSHYPVEIALIGEQMTALSQQIVCAALEFAGIPPSVWLRGSGSCSHAEGAYHLTFNHYRTQLDAVGLSAHKDDGFLTILRTTRQGLEVNRCDRWERVDAAPDLFVINFGLSMEILTARCPSPVSAILHRVSKQTEDRTSFGHFSASNFIERDQGCFTYCPEQGLQRALGKPELLQAHHRDHSSHILYSGCSRDETA